MRRVMLCLLLLAATSSPAFATCTFQSIGSIPFSYNPIGGAAATASAAMTITCDASSSTNVTVALDPGTHVTGSPNPWRKLLNSTNNQTLNYNIYTDSAYTVIWGDGTNGTSAQTQAQSVGSFTFTLYGMIPGGQNVAAGTYSDTVTATMTF